MQRLLRELADMAERADQVAEAFRRGTKVAVWDPDLRRGTHVGAYRWTVDGRAAYKAFRKDTERRFSQQRLEEIKGFLNYVTRTCPWINPYIKGLHLTIDGWRPGRVAGGWRD